jgi:hypothetical protein
LSSYQDVNWGGDESTPITENAVSLDELDDYLRSRWGYQRLPSPIIDPYAPDQFQDYFHRWVKDGLPPISIAKPQFRAKGIPGMVYDIDDIQLLLDRLDGSDGDDDPNDGHRLTARRRDPS